MNLKQLSNSLGNSVRKATRRLALAAACVLVCGAAQVKAADFVMETKVAGYSKAGWILVVPEMRARLGGAVRFDAARNRYITDRVSRGEPVQVTILPSTLSECVYRISIVGLTQDNTVKSGVFTFLPARGTYTVSKDPNFDNVGFYAVTTSGVFQKRIPIGTR